MRSMNHFIHLRILECFYELLVVELDSVLLSNKEVIMAFGVREEFS